MSTRNFYQDLPAVTEFSKAFNPASYQNAPDDWWVIVADIIDSTKAIETGHYKAVNFVGSLPIISVLNLLTPLTIPYVFGGDGATLLVAESDKARVLDVLIATAQFAGSVYGIHYRLGAVKVQMLRQQGNEVKIAKFTVSKNYQQAFFMGGGTLLADNLVKKNAAFQIDINQKTMLEPDFSGLECRWQDIHNDRGKVLCLLLETIDNKLDYKNILQHLESIVGNKNQRSVVSKKSLKLSFSPKQLITESKVFCLSHNIMLRMFRIMLENLIGKFLMGFSVNQWQFYKENLLQTTDSEKFDDTLRMVIAVTENQQQQLIDYLEHEYQTKKLIYGVHVSDRALMTCLIFERHGQQVHFIDAADGGYALAAKAFKQRKQDLHALTKT
jgi:hypothetical protein